MDNQPNRYVPKAQWQPLKRKRVKSVAPLILVFFFFFLALVFVYTRNHADISIISGIAYDKQALNFPLQCVKANQTQKCPKNYPTTYNLINLNSSSNVMCPSYFRWIHEDLRPWLKTGITRYMVERAKKTAHFRLVIIDGKVYVERYKKSIETRDVFTLWGILQLLRRYPGRLPDLELMFDCDDEPVIKSSAYNDSNVGPPPLFRYCSDEKSLDIVFPDWSFWGWAEINIKPWRIVLEDIKEGNKRTQWKDREPYAYWKGNPYVSPERLDLLKCNVTVEHDWDARLYIQKWSEESKHGFKTSNLEDQCTHRKFSYFHEYKIYIEGTAWSVSEKYILGCNSMTLYVKPRFFDFFARGMMPLQHYWPIRSGNDKCMSLKFAVEWGNSHTDEAEAIGVAASRFIQEEMKMEYIFDYMFHVLNAYGKLLKFKPSIPPGATELCPETMACSAKGNYKKFMLDSLESYPSDTISCTLPPPYTQLAREELLDRKKKVETWEKEYWQGQMKGHKYY